MKLCTATLLAGLCFLPRAAGAADCTPLVARDPSGGLSESEDQLRAKIAKAVICEADNPRRKNLPRIVEYTDLYIELAQKPVCQLLLINAQAKISLATDLDRKGSLTAQEKERLGALWQGAWNVLAGISSAWSKQTASTTQPSIVDKCVKPAREQLSRFPSVTITLNPPDSSGFELRWDKVSRTNSLPRMFPGRHELFIDPPREHTVSLKVGREQVVSDHLGRVVRPIRLEWNQRLQIQINFQDLTPSPCPTRESCAGSEPLPGEFPSRSNPRAPVAWASGAAIALGIGGVIFSLSTSNTLNNQGNELYVGGGCGTSAPSCRRDEVEAKYDASDNWKYWGTGASSGLAALGGIGLYWALSGPSHPATDDGARATVPGATGSLRASVRRRFSGLEWTTSF